MTALTKALIRAQEAVARPVRSAAVRSERGDVPGWVLVTLMTAGIVAVLWKVAGDRLTALFNQAMDSVSH